MTILVGGTYDPSGWKYIFDPTGCRGKLDPTDWRDIYDLTASPSSTTTTSSCTILLSFLSEKPQDESFLCNTVHLIKW